MTDLRKELAHVINTASAENESNTPDFIPAQYLQSCLDAFDAAVRERDRWYGIAPEPGQSADARFLEADLRELIGWLSADVPELHAVEVPRLAESLQRWLAARRAETEGEDHG